MKPKNLALFCTAIVVSQIGIWLFAFTLFWLSRDNTEIVGANIGAGMLGLLSWALGIVSFILFILSYLTPSKQSL